MSEYAIEVDKAISRLVVIEEYDSGMAGPHVHTFRIATTHLTTNGTRWDEQSNTLRRAS